MGSTSSRQFLDDILTRFLACMNQRQEGNYDADRFSFDGVDRSQDFNLEEHKRYLYFLFSNYRKLAEVSSLLGDNSSRDLFAELILYRLGGHLHVKLTANNERHWRMRQEASHIPSAPSRFAFSSMFGKLRHFEAVPFNGTRLNVDTWPGNPAWVFLLRQYFFERGCVSIQPRPNDHVIDAGACFGDTALAFATTVGAEGHVYSFDPLSSHNEVMRFNAAQNNLSKTISIFPVALGEYTNALPGPFLAGNIVDAGFRLNRSEEIDDMPIRSIDSLNDSGDLERIDFIKMDIEGSELSALRGAERSIRKYKPRLAISIYHKNADFFEIPLYIHNLGLGYRLYIEHYTIHLEETILYATTI